MMEQRRFLNTFSILPESTAILVVCPSYLYVGRCVRFSDEKSEFKILAKT